MQAFTLTVECKVGFSHSNVKGLSKSIPLGDIKDVNLSKHIFHLSYLKFAFSGANSLSFLLVEELFNFERQEVCHLQDDQSCIFKSNESTRFTLVFHKVSRHPRKNGPSFESCRNRSWHSTSASLIISQFPMCSPSSSKPSPY